ncbi:hypothetical protein KJ859_02145, partial [Patescibacteria group bacterium]|nr:hypothetical protein [Patescibacteria group bacterium]
MSKKYSILKTGLTVLLATLMVGAVVNATTTVGDNVSVGGTLGATGATTLSSTLAVTGISTLTGALTANGGVTIGTAATGLTFTGGYTTTAIQLGTSASNMTLAVYDDHVIDINVTSGSTDGSNSVRPIHMISTMTGVGGVGGRAEFVMATEVVLGGWANALKGYTDFGTAGSVTGLGSAIVAEMRMPAKALAGGNYAPLELELVLQEASRTSGTPVSFMHAQASQASGTSGLGDFNDTGYFMSVQGLTGAANDLLSLTSQTLKTRIGTATRYMVLSQLQDGLGLGNSTTAMDLTT